MLERPESRLRGILTLRSLRFLCGHGYEFPMKRFLARELLWLAASFVGALALWLLIVFQNPNANVGIEPIVPNALTIYGISAVVRGAIWAIRTVIRTVRTTK